NHATVTSCDFDEPHVRVVTGDLRIDPFQEEGKARYRLRLKDNRVELYNWLKIPLPVIDVNTNKNFEPLWPTLSLADSARLGTLSSCAYPPPADSGAHFLDGIFGRNKPPAPAPPQGEQQPGAQTAGPPPKPRQAADGHYKINASYLGSRGGLLDLGLEVSAKDNYWLDIYLGLVLDHGEDRGFIRVPENERDSLRRWLRGQAYFLNGDSAWTISYTDQSDAGVQSEFYEGQFLRYERSETYVQWHKSSEEYFEQATVK